MEWVVEHWWIGLVIIGGGFVVGVIAAIVEGDGNKPRSSPFLRGMMLEPDPTLTQALAGMVKAFSILAIQWVGPAYLFTALVGWTVLELKS